MLVMIEMTGLEGSRYLTGTVTVDTRRFAHGPGTICAGFPTPPVLGLGESHIPTFLASNCNWAGLQPCFTTGGSCTKPDRKVVSRLKGPAIGSYKVSRALRQSRGFANYLQRAQNM